MAKKLSKEEIRKRRAARKQYEISQGGNFATYFGMLGNSFSSQVNLLAQLVQHQASLGNYKERLLIKVISDFLPTRYAVGTGFVVFPVRRDFIGDVDPNIDMLNSYSHTTSRQLDIIVYDAANYPPLFVDGDFIVVRPESVRSVIEVKGSLKREEVERAVSLFVDYAKKLKTTQALYRELGIDPIGLPSFFLMGWQFYIPADGPPDCDPQRLGSQIVEDYMKLLPKNELEGSPLLKSAFVHDKCQVTGTIRSDEKGITFGYSTQRGRFALYNDEGKVAEGGDATISLLLAGIQSSLEQTSNQLFDYVDQSIVDEVLPYEHSSYCAWLSEDELHYVIELPKDSGDAEAKA